LSAARTIPPGHPSWPYQLARTSYDVEYPPFAHVGGFQPLRTLTRP
jgi:hypothetical protein